MRGNANIIKFEKIKDMIPRYAKMHVITDVLNIPKRYEIIDNEIATLIGNTKMIFYNGEDKLSLHSYTLSNVSSIYTHDNKYYMIEIYKELNEEPDKKYIKEVSDHNSMNPWNIKLCDDFIEYSCKKRTNDTYIIKLGEFKIIEHDIFFSTKNTYQVNALYINDMYYVNYANLDNTHNTMYIYGLNKNIPPNLFDKFKIKKELRYLINPYEELSDRDPCLYVNCFPKVISTDLKCTKLPQILQFNNEINIMENIFLGRWLWPWLDRSYFNAFFSKQKVEEAYKNNNKIFSKVSYGIDHSNNVLSNYLEITIKNLMNVFQYQEKACKIDNIKRNAFPFLNKIFNIANAHRIGYLYK